MSVGTIFKILVFVRVYVGLAESIFPCNQNHHYKSKLTGKFCLKKTEEIQSKNKKKFDIFMIYF